MRVWALPCACAVPWQCVGLSAYLCVTFRCVCVCVCVWWQRHCRAPIEPALSTCIKLPALTLHHPELWQPPNWKHRPDQGRYIINTHTHTLYTRSISLYLSAEHTCTQVHNWTNVSFLDIYKFSATQFLTPIFFQCIFIYGVIFLNCLSLTCARSLYTYTHTQKSILLAGRVFISTYKDSSVFLFLFLSRFITGTLRTFILLHNSHSILLATLFFKDVKF